MHFSPLFFSDVRPRRSRRSWRHSTRPELEVLEDRLAPATMGTGQVMSSAFAAAFAFASAQSSSQSSSSSSSASATAIAVASSTGAFAFASASASVVQQQNFVQACYQAELGRNGSTAELNAWVKVLDGPGGQAAVCAGIMNSVEAQEHLVKSWYTSFLGRSASSAEAMAWVGMLQAGQSEEQVLSGILGSAEFAAHAQSMGFGGTEEQNQVQALYTLLLGRTGSAAEVSAWVSVLPQVGAQAMAFAFLRSQEFRTDTVGDYYSILLHRAPDPTGLNGFVLSSMYLCNIRLAIECSPEFFADAGAVSAATAVAVAS